MHTPTVDEREQLMGIKLYVVFQLKKKSGNMEGCFLFFLPFLFFFKLPSMSGGKKSRKEKENQPLHVIHV